MKIGTRLFGIVGIFLCVVSGMFLHAQELDTIGDALKLVPASVQSQMETYIFNFINQNRVANSLPALILSPAAVAQARSHSLDMANHIVLFNHQGAEQRLATLKQQIPSITRFGENIAYNRSSVNPPYTATLAWLGSQAHLANIMSDYDSTGIGVFSNVLGEYYFTQIFVKSKSPMPAHAVEAPFDADKAEVVEIKNEALADPITWDKVDSYIESSAQELMF